MKKILILVILTHLSLILEAQIVSPVTWSYASKKTSSHEAVIYLKAKIADGWHIYSINQKRGGPDKTMIDFSPTKDFSLIGKMIEPKPSKEFSEIFDLDLLYFEKSVVFTQKIKLHKDEIIVKGKVNFMACTDKECIPSNEVSFSIPVK